MTRLRTAADSAARDAAETGARFAFGVCALVALVYALWLLVAWPSGDFPLNDDWAYAWSVRRLLETGALRISEWASAAALFQIYWGALFATLAGGFSFTALHVSTLVFSAGAPLALCWLLRRLGVGRAGAALAAVALVANPIFLHLSYTFMTDVFYLGFLLVSLALYAEGTERDSGRALWLASVAAALAFLCRQLGVVLPIAAALVLLLRHRRAALRRVVQATLVPLVVVVAYTSWLRDVHGLPWAFQLNVVQNGLANLLRASAPLELCMRVLHVMLYLGVFALPALAALLASGRLDARRARTLRWPFATWFVLLACTTAWTYRAGEFGMPYLDGVITREGIGGATIGGTKPRVTPDDVFEIVSLVAPFAGAAVAALWTDALANARREIAGRGAVLLLASLGMAGLTAPMVKLWDEYLLVFLPASLYLVLREAGLSARGLVAGGLVCASMLAYALPEQAEYLAWNDARWRLGRQLVQQGAAPQQIQGGFEWVGWYDFEAALPLAIAAGRGDDLFGWVAVFPDQYFMAFQPLGVTNGRSKVSGVVPYRSRFGPGGEIYALEVNPAGVEKE